MCCLIQYCFLSVESTVLKAFCGPLSAPTKPPRQTAGVEEEESIEIDRFLDTYHDHVKPLLDTSRALVGPLNHRSAGNIFF